MTAAFKPTSEIDLVEAIIRLSEEAGKAAAASNADYDRGVRDAAMWVRAVGLTQLADEVEQQPWQK